MIKKKHLQQHRQNPAAPAATAASVASSSGSSSSGGGGGRGHRGSNDRAAVGETRERGRLIRTPNSIETTPSFTGTFFLSM